MKPPSGHDEVSTLIQTLARTGQRLEELTAGQVDTVLDPDGRTFLLRGAQEELSLSEDAKQAAILNALPAHIALLDSAGTIISVNNAWRRFANLNAAGGASDSIGLNYLEICNQAGGGASSDGHKVAEGIRSVLHGEQTGFSFEYSCHSPAEEGWFQLIVTPLHQGRLTGAVVMHINVTERKQSAETLRASLEEFRTLAEAMPQIVWITRADGWCIYFNQLWMDYTGLTLEESLGNRWTKPFHPEDQQRAQDSWKHATINQRSHTIECRLRRADGMYRWWLIRGLPVRDKSGTILKWFGTCTDIHDLKVTEEALFVEKESAQVRLNSIGDAVFCIDKSGNINFLNSVAEKMTGWSFHESTGKSLPGILRLKDAVTGETTSNQVDTAIGLNGTLQLPSNCIFTTRDGIEIPIEGSVAPIPGRDGQPIGAVIVVRDVTMARAMASRLVHLAEHDSLTGLPNRLLLNDRVTQAIVSAPRHQKKLALLFLDLDGFKHINDSLGHPTGDSLLQSVGKRLVDCVRATDTVSRQGGDEFIVLLSEVENPEDAAITARRMLQAVAEPHSIGLHDLQISTCIGVSVYPDDGLDAETLIKNADTAMYQAKENGRHSYRFFKPAMNARAVERQFIEESLRRALERREFVLHYQPKICLGTGAITGVEALLRWVHPARGPIPPSHFIPVAEDCGLILRIGRWALREACKQARIWADAGLPKISMAVNVSASELSHEGFLEGLLATLKETELDPKLLELELTESVLMKRTDSTASTLRELRTLGIQIAVDDFGTGYSSLSYLRKFPIDALKIDQSFIRQMTSAPEDATIVTAIISMARSMRLRVIAEGVETLEELSFLQTLKCDEAQGYYFSQPVNPQRLAELLESGLAKGAGR